MQEFIKVKLHNGQKAYIRAEAIVAIYESREIPCTIIDVGNGEDNGFWAKEPLAEVMAKIKQIKQEGGHNCTETR